MNDIEIYKWEQFVQKFYIYMYVYVYIKLDKLKQSVENNRTTRVAILSFYLLYNIFT